VPQEVRALIGRLSEENRRWGPERLRGELLTLGITVANGSIRRSRWRPAPRPPGQTWRTFLRTHAHQIWAADLCTVPTAASRTLSVVCFITHDRRELVHRRVTARPPAAWVWRQLLEATARGPQPASLLRDRDAVDGRDFPSRAQALGIHTLLTPFRAPRANALAERVVRTVRDEGLDRVPVVNERPLEGVLREYLAYDNAARPHRSLGLGPPLPGPSPSRAPNTPPGRIVARPVLGGLHHVYQRAA
jgi:hypothetical protein